MSPALRPPPPPPHIGRHRGAPPRRPRPTRQRKADEGMDEAKFGEQEEDKATEGGANPLQMVTTHAPAPESSVPTVRLIARCARGDEFIERFAAYVDESTLLLPAHEGLPIGEER